MTATMISQMLDNMQADGTIETWKPVVSQDGRQAFHLSGTATNGRPVSSLLEVEIVASPAAGPVSGLAVRL